MEEASDQAANHEYRIKLVEPDGQVAFVTTTWSLQFALDLLKSHMQSLQECEAGSKIEIQWVEED